MGEEQLAPWPYEVLEVVLDNAPRSTLAQCIRINSTWYDASVKRLYEHYDLLPSVNGRSTCANLTRRKANYLKRTRHLTVWTHDARVCHSEAAPDLPSLRTLSVHAAAIHEGERAHGRRRCPLLKGLQPSTIIFHGPHFPVTVSQIWELVGGRDIVVAYDPTKASAHFSLIDRWPTIVNPDGAPRSLTVVFVPQSDEYFPKEVRRYTNLRGLASWLAMLPSDRPVTIVDVSAGVDHEQLASMRGVRWPLAQAWEEGGRTGFVQCVKECFLNDVKTSMEFEASVEGGPGVGDEHEGGIGQINIEARLANIHFMERDEFMATPVATDVFAK